MDHQQQLEKLLDSAAQHRFAMLVTQADDGGLRARPMTVAELDREEGEIWFMTSRDSEACANLVSSPIALAAMQSGSSYVQLSGVGEVVADRYRVRELWSPAYQLWFPKGPDSPDVVLIKVRIEMGEYWDQSGVMQIRTYLKRAAGALRGRNANEETTEDDAIHARVNVR